MSSLGFFDIDIKQGISKLGDPLGRRRIKRKQYHVTPDPSWGWNVKESGVKKPLKHFETKEVAVIFARNLCKKAGVELFIHGRDGRIQECESFHRESPQGKEGPG